MVDGGIMTAAVDLVDTQGGKQADIRVPANTLWREVNLPDGRAWCAGAADENLATAICKAFDAEKPETAIAAAVQAVQSQFAIVVQSGTNLACAVDKIRSIPLIWSRAANGTMVVAQLGDALFDGLSAQGSTRPPIDLSQARAVAMSGCTIGPATLYEGVSTLLSGEFLLAQGDQAPVTHSYFRYLPWQDIPTSPAQEESSEQLEAILLGALKETVRKADGRCIAVPLSAGLDSRYIASGLRQIGYENVLCFSYGQQGNRESQAARKIAQELGYRWEFFPYELSAMREAFADRAYQGFIEYSDSLTSVHFPQDFIAVSGLLRNQILPTDAIVVNGQSGDFLTGNHIPRALADLPETAGAGTEPVIDALLKKHFALWGHLQTSAQHAAVKSLLTSEFDYLAGGELPAESQQLFGLFEASEYIDRQSKYVVNGQRSYEQLGLDWDLPLWHGDLIEFYAAQPLSAKLGQKLYRDTLMRMNWQGVWRDIPVNPTRLRPWWLPPVRNALKLMHVPLGKTAWHRFERRYLGYFMSTLCAYAIRDWSQVARDGRNPRSARAYHVEDYLLRHGVNLADIEGTAP